MEYTVTAIVPAYNRERNIGVVLSTLLGVNQYISEVLCVYDGNDNTTLQIIRSFPKVKLFHSQKRHGKAYAIAKGVEKAKGEIVLFIDADIKGLNANILRQLIKPLYSGKYDAAIGYRCSKMEATLGVPLSGERAYFRKDILLHKQKFKKKGYGLELYLNYHFKNKRQKFFRMKDVYSYPKHAKYPRITATKLYLEETHEVLQEIISQRNIFNYFLNSYVRYVYFREQSIRDYLRY